VPLKIYLFIWRCINSFYTRIQEVAGDRALLPVEEHVGADAVVAATLLAEVSQHLSIDVQLVPSLAGTTKRCRYIPAVVASSTPTATLERRPWNGGGVKCLTLIGLSMTFFVNMTSIANVIFDILYHHYP